jgi:hypothetical protein
VILRVRIFDAEIWWIDVMRDNFFIKALRRGAFVAVLAVPLYYFTSIESYDVWGVEVCSICYCILRLFSVGRVRK